MCSSPLSRKDQTLINGSFVFRWPSKRDVADISSDVVFCSNIVFPPVHLHEEHLLSKNQLTFKKCITAFQTTCGTIFCRSAMLLLLLLRSPFFRGCVWARHLFSSLHSFVAVSPTPTSEDSVSVRVICLFPDP